MSFLIYPHAFSPTLCEGLMRYFETRPSRESGRMVARDDGTIEERINPVFKSRRDVSIAQIDPAARSIERALAPVIAAARAAFSVDVAFLERHLIARYDADENGHFADHVDNFLPGTTHRQVALSVVLNEDYENGQMVLPHLGIRARPPAGSAILFECSELHRVNMVTRGRRYAYLTFLFDHAGKALLEKSKGAIASPERPLDSRVMASPEGCP